MQSSLFFFFNDTATTEIYTLSLHDALPICSPPLAGPRRAPVRRPARSASERSDGPDHLGDHPDAVDVPRHARSEEHTSELQSRQYLVCRLLLEKKKHRKIIPLRQGKLDSRL